MTPAFVILNFFLLVSAQVDISDFHDFYSPENVKERELIISYTPKYHVPVEIRRDQTIFGPPPIDDTVAVCRYVTHMADWASMTTLSSRLSMDGLPDTTIKAMVDGPYNISTGVPYLYISYKEYATKDLMKNRKTTLVLSMKETKECQSLGDNDDPGCARVILSGKIKKVNDGTSEHLFATTAMTDRHPQMSKRAAEDMQFVIKLKISQVALMDAYGEAEYIPVSQYLAFNYTGPFVIVSKATPIV